MSLSREEVLDAIAEMSVMDVVQLVEAMEEKFGVSAAAAVAAAPVAAAGGDAAPAEEKDEFDIVLTAAGDKKVNVIKAVQQRCYQVDDEARWAVALVSDTGLRLSEALGLVKDDVII